MDDASSEIAVQENPAPSRLAQVVGVTAFCIASVIVYAGGFALHIWTCYLFFNHWGGFWGIAAFFFPFLCELVALVACFFWGAWFYILAVILWLISLPGIALAGEGKRQGKVALIWLLAATSLSLVFIYFAWAYAVAPARLTPELRKELDEVATAIVVTMRSAASDDALSATQVAEAQPILRRRIQKYDTRAVDEIRRSVDAFLVSEELLFNDTVVFLAGAGPGDRPPQFRLGEKTREALGALPGPMRNALNCHDVSLLERQVQELLGSSAGKMPYNWREHLRGAHEHQKRVYQQVYSDLLGRTMPGQRTQ
jgi:hypothetical protein